jgi:hypothetical protein
MNAWHAMHSTYAYILLYYSLRVELDFSRLEYGISKPWAFEDESHGVTASRWGLPAPRKTMRLAYKVPADDWMN